MFADAMTMAPRSPVATLTRWFGQWRRRRAERRLVRLTAQDLRRLSLYLRRDLGLD